MSNEKNNPIRVKIDAAKALKDLFDSLPRRGNPIVNTTEYLKLKTLEGPITDHGKPKEIFPWMPVGTYNFNRKYFPFGHDPYMGLLGSMGMPPQRKEDFTDRIGAIIQSQFYHINSITNNMAKTQYVSTHGENSLGGKLVTKKNGTQKLTIASKINGKKIVEIIDNPEQIKEFVDKVLNILDHIWQALVDFFGSVANRFPCQIKMGEKIYTYTEQPARFKGIDKVFYQYNEDKNYEILMFEDTHMSRARRKLRVELKKQGYM